MKVTVVIPNYNGKALLEKHLPNVIASVRKTDEIIVVDDASTDDSVAFLKSRYPEITCIVHKINSQYAQSCNDGVDRAANDIIILLNNDVSPKKDFLQPLLVHFDSPDVFAVGCAEENEQGYLSGRSLGSFSHGMLIHRRAEDQGKDTTLWAAGGSMAVRRSLWLKMGGMDTLFRPAYEEDRDLSYRAWKMDYIVKFEPNSLVYHQHETTNASVIGLQNLTVASYKNMFVFYWKNITDKDLIVQHVLWLGYHLIIGGIRSRGLIIRGFLQALAQFSEMLKERKHLMKQWKLTDSKVMEKIGTV